MPPRKSNNFQVKNVDSEISVTNKNAGAKVLKGLHDLWQQQKFCDVLIKSNGEEILAHRAVLVIQCDYFRAMFCMGFEESRQQRAEVTLDEVSPQTVRAIIKYMYTGKLMISKDVVQELVVITDLLQMLELKDICSHYMEQELHVNNCLGVWNFSERFDCPTLTAKSQILIKQTFPIVSQMEEFLQISPETIIKILECNDLYLGHKKEDLAFEAVIRWLEHQPEERVLEFQRVLKNIRLKYVSPGNIKQFLQSNIAQSYPEVKQFIDTQLATQEDTGPREVVQHLYVIGGYLQSRTGPFCPRLSAVERFSFQEDKWESVASLPNLASAVHAFVLFGRLCCIVTSPMFRSFQDFPTNEHEKDIFVEGFYEYDILQNVWKDSVNSFSKDVLKLLYKCLKNSGSIAVCTDSNKIYIVTNDTVTCLQAELDDGDIVCQGKESTLKLDHVTEDYANFVAVVMDRNLYVLGGYIDQNNGATDVVCMYDSHVKVWTNRSNMLEPRSHFDAVVLDDSLYAIGGVSNRRLKTVEKYDPQTDQWSYMASMDMERSYCKALVFLDKIYVLGGKSYANRLAGGARKVLNTCEVYNPRTNSWSYIPPMKSARCLFGAATY